MIEPKRSMRARVRAGIVLASLIAAVALPQVASAQKQSAELTKYQRKNRTTADKAIDALFQQSRAILIVATPGMKYKYPTEAVLDENLADEVTDTGSAAAVDYSMVAEWVHAADPDSMIVVAQHLPVNLLGPAGYFYRIEGAKTDYLVFVVEPGTYSLQKVNYPRPRSGLNEGHGTVLGRGTASVGELRQVASSMLEAEQTTVFLNAASTTVAASEQCNWWYKGVCTQSVYTPEHTKQTRAAGYYPKTEYRPIPALDVNIKFNDEVASFQVDAGEVILVDSLSPEPLDTEMGVGSCRSGETMQVCALQSIELTRAAGSLDEVRAFDFAAEFFPRLGKLVSKIQYRPLQLNGTRIGESKFGERYRISR